MFANVFYILYINYNKDKNKTHHQVQQSVLDVQYVPETLGRYCSVSTVGLINIQVHVAWHL